MPITVSDFVVKNRLFAIRSARNNWAGAGFTKHLAKRIRIVAFVGNYISGFLQFIRQQFHRSNVTDVASRQPHGERATYDIGEDMELGRLAAA